MGTFANLDAQMQKDLLELRSWNHSTKRYDMMLENMPQIEWLK